MGMQLEYPRELFERLVREHSIQMNPAHVEGLGRLIDTVFFASLLVEEGSSTKVAIVHNERGVEGLAEIVDESPSSDEEDPKPAWDVTAIRPKPFDAPTLAKLSRGLKYGSQLLVIGGSARYEIVGIARIRRRSDGGDATRIASPRPGTLVFERRRQQILRYEAGQQGKPTCDVIGSPGPVRAALRRILGEEDLDHFARNHGGGHMVYSYPEFALRRLVRSMRATEAGAILAMLPKSPTLELLATVKYEHADPMTLANRIKNDYELSMLSLSKRIARHGEDQTNEQIQAREAAERAEELAAEELESAIEDVAQLSAIDGAVIAGPSLAIYGAGCVLPSKEVAPEIVRRALNSEGTKIEEYRNDHGARHRAAFSFAHENPGAVVFVTSEDGAVKCVHAVDDTVLVWSVEVLET
jgi:hypothetical protein